MKRLLLATTAILGLATAMAGATVIEPTLFLPMLVAHTWLFGYDHLVATYTKLAGRPGGRAGQRRLPFFLPPPPLLLPRRGGLAGGQAQLQGLLEQYVALPLVGAAGGRVDLLWGAADAGGRLGGRRQAHLPGH